MPKKGNKTHRVVKVDAGQSADDTGRSNALSLYRRRFKARPRRMARIHRRRRIARPTRVVRPKWSNAMAQTKLYKFKYADTGFNISTTGTIGSVGQHVFTGNGMYDPDVTGAGVQPYQFDSLVTAQAFAYYTCFASKIKVTFYKSTPADNIVFTVVPCAAASLAYVNQDDLRVMPYARQKRMADNYRQITTIVNYCTYNKMRPVPVENVSNGTYNANPTLQWYWHIVADTNAQGTDEDILFDVEITYYVKLSRSNNADES